MEAAIRLHLSELTEKSISRIKEIFSNASNKKNPELIITLSTPSQKNSKYFDTLDIAIQQFKDGDIVTFSMDELEKYIKEDVIK